VAEEMIGLPITVSHRLSAWRLFERGSRCRATSAA